LLHRANGQPPLDGDRYEQLLHAITGAELLANTGPHRVEAAGWQPVRLINERIINDGEGTSTYEATIVNPNDARSPVPAVCILSRNPLGELIGHWLVFPSDPSIPPCGEIEIRGRTTWPENGKPAGMRFAETVEDFHADGLRDRFPGPGGGTRHGV
jgi:hypothetical protein